jgi:very-short-patch-repair endonuclease
LTKHKNNHYNKSLLKYSRELRSEKASKGERFLWKLLSSKKQTGIRFLRQRPIKNYIVDFFAPEIGLIIEIDGSSHITKGNYDEKRQKELQDLGYHFLRFSEGEVLNQIDNVSLKITHAIEVLSERKRSNE